MSNLQLPTLTYTNLDRMMGKHARLRIGYETWAERVGGDIVVTHHWSAILQLNADGSVEASHAGYSTSTTVARLEKAMCDNAINRGADGWSIAIRDGAAALVDRHNLRKPVLHLSEISSGWLRFVDGEPVLPTA